MELAGQILAKSRYPLIYGLSRSSTDGQRAAVRLADQLGAVLDTEAGTGPSLGNGPVLDDTDCQAVEQTAADLKSRMGEKKLDFDALAELVAELTSIDAQLSSPKPKTAIVRECFRAIANVLEKAGDTGDVKRIKTLLGEPAE